jgi:23S rRNA (cytidine1920-2'-O)/16S rRNA (cytidine1409-2'-O)-methyltransferase
MKSRTERTRLDVILVERGLSESRQKAQAMILAGEVTVNGKRAEKAGLSVPLNASIEVTSKLRKYASRGGLKLEGVLEDFAVRVEGKICLDVGASTGGFTDCLVQHGAERVYAVDVNTKQLAWKLQKDARVVPIEKNARQLRREDLEEAADLVVIDVSFISATKVLCPAVAAAKPGAEFLVLIKPQFELRREDVGRNGIVRAAALHEKAVASVRAQAVQLGLECLGIKPSRLAGAEGNQEYFLHARKGA